MRIEDEIVQRVRAAGANLDDFQIKAGENGYVLINLKTGRAELIFDEFSKLSDLKQLFPNLHFVDTGRE